MNKCLYCNREYMPLRADSKYCSSQCRLLAFRKLSVSNKSEISVSKDDKISVPRLSVSKVKYDPNIHKRQLTENEQLGLTEYGKCHGCGKVVSELICICQECFKKGMTHKSLNLNIAKCDY